nr:DUF6273 domain-containing protein [Clostridia bacterium]
MKKKLLRKLPLIVCAVLVLSVAAAGTVVLRHAATVKAMSAPAAAEKTQRRYVYFGSYPQTLVEDRELLGRLGSLELNWQDYGYYSGDGTIGSAAQTPCMYYADVDYDGETYRAVRIEEYRSYCCHMDRRDNWQSGVLGYSFEKDTVYFFRFDPIRWLVLSEEENLLLAEPVLDSQPINSLIYSKTPKKGFDSSEFYEDPSFGTIATDYSASGIRAWLNSTFIDTAFSADEAGLIEPTDLDNSSFSEGSSKFDAPDTTDRVFLLSYSDVTDPRYGFSARAEKPDGAKVAFSTAYARIQGHWVHSTGASYWWCRTAKGRTAVGGAALNIAVNYVGTISISYQTP